jgi:hypothetical protein
MIQPVLRANSLICLRLRTLLLPRCFLNSGQDLNDGHARLGLRLELPAIEELALEGGEEALRHGVVISVPDRSCRNREEMKKDAAARAAILASLERQLKKGDKTLVGNKGYRRFLATNACKPWRASVG